MKAEDYVKSVLSANECCQDHLIELMLERIVQETYKPGRDDGRLLVDAILLVVEKHRKRGDRGAGWIVSLIARISDILFIKSDRGDLVPQSSPSSLASAASPHPLLLDLLSHLSAYMFTHPIYVGEGEQASRIFVPADVLRRAILSAPHSEQETRNRQLKLLATSAHHSIQLLSPAREGNMRRNSEEDARHAQLCLTVVEENIPLAVAVPAMFGLVPMPH